MTLDQLRAYRLVQFETQMTNYWRGEYEKAIMHKLRRQIERIENEGGHI